MTSKKSKNSADEAPANVALSDTKQHSDTKQLSDTKPLELITCDCGAEVSRKGFTAHIKSNRHIAKMSTSEETAKNQELGALLRQMIKEIVLAEVTVADT